MTEITGVFVAAFTRAALLAIRPVSRGGLPPQIASFRTAIELDEIQTRLGRQLRFVFRNFPLATAHPHAERAAEVGLPNFLGPLTQGPATGRFIYIDIGRLAGQKDCEWERRLKVPLSGITWDLIRDVSANPKLVLEAHLPGTAKDGGPSCASVHPLVGWKCRRAK
jgi:hypothetical protein